MRRRAFRLGSLTAMMVALAVLAVGCTGAGQGAPPSPTEPSTPSGTPGAAPRDSDGPDVPYGERVEETLGAMSLEDKVRQLLMLHVYGAHADDTEHGAGQANQRLYGTDTIAGVLRRHRPGGIIFIERNPLDEHAADTPTRNLQSLEQISNLTAAVQGIAVETQGIGMLLATDQEQGPIVRLPPPASTLAGGATLGATGDIDLAERNAKQTGQELLQVGINLNFAPVADVNTNADNPVIGERAFGDHPDLVSSMVAAQVRGYRAAGIAATAKHFPGHGATDADSHQRLPVVNLPRDEWHTTHLPPFVAAIEEDVAAVMTAHVSAPALDESETPATLSRPILTDLLREEFGFDGVVVTDAMWMRAIRDHYDDAEAALSALRAGADIILMPPEPDRTVEHILDAVRHGHLDEDRIDDSVRRVLTLKHQLGLVRPNAH